MKGPVNMSMIPLCSFVWSILHIEINTVHHVPLISIIKEIAITFELIRIYWWNQLLQRVKTEIFTLCSITSTLLLLAREISIQYSTSTHTLWSTCSVKLLRCPTHTNTLNLSGKFYNQKAGKRVEPLRWGAPKKFGKRTGEGYPTMSGMEQMRKQFRTLYRPTQNYTKQIYIYLET